MALGSIGSHGSSGENIVHIGGFRIRATGSGQLRFRFYSMDNIYDQLLPPLTLVSATNIQPFRLANFMQQRSYLEVRVDTEGESFNINRIIIYAKTVFTMHPA